MNEKTKRLLLLNIPYLVLALLFTKASQAWRFAVGYDFASKFLNLTSGFALAFENPLPSLHSQDLLIGFLFGAVLRLVVYVKGKNAKKYRKGIEYGSARWGNTEDIRPFADPLFHKNVILTKTESLTMSSRPKNPKHARNKNVLIVGGSGSGKTRFWLKPNLMQCHSSYVVTDPKGSIVVECGKMLLRNGYKIKILNTINFKKSMRYNPFAYIKSEKDILKLVTTLIANTKGEGKAGDDFWVKAETLLYTALIGYIYFEAPENEQNFSTLIEFINASEVREDDEDFQNPVDLMFETLEKKDPQHFAVRQYKKYKLAAGKTAKSILISCGARLAPFDIKELRELTAYDELELDTLGDKKTALFIIISDTDDTFNFLVSMAYTQLFNLLCDKADDVYGGRLPIHVRCLIDEAANIGQIPKLEKLMATIRSREISACLVLQAQSQLKALYKDNADTIIGNCDSMIFLGGKEKTTLKDLSETLGKETIDMFNTSDTRGAQRSYGLNYQKLGKELMSMDELAVMDGGKCILQLRGVRPFLSEKYDITKHPQYKYLSDFDKRNTFNIEKYLSTKLKPKPDEVYDVYEIDLTDETETA
ncbi:type IV secretory system conjugative DNA transfer family protein [Dehalobacterium formicoaceticum]|uniref:Type IV secretory system conjugative DNA transfer family protein n=1 Tax=Dehalobacterium formicoaceticum TaxID=51515 RepID=A0ABT1Y836_9FIRM|nr:type IV secretory system conjugative DNA transfer family protein [Dehalobacterium formicoaceticum]MCR6546728.1 type IV secretory system conjugative DNA transfer family protein [Dehalobacterium formicoaceticum]